MPGERSRWGGRSLESCDIAHGTTRASQDLSLDTAVGGHLVVCGHLDLRLGLEVLLHGRLRGRSSIKEEEEMAMKTKIEKWGRSKVRREERWVGRQEVRWIRASQD